jgi:hypothetical protein
MGRSNHHRATALAANHLWIFTETNSEMNVYAHVGPPNHWLVRPAASFGWTAVAVAAAAQPLR